MADTNKQFEEVMSRCRDLFANKLHDYGVAWRILRIPSVTDQLLIKAKRIRSLQMKGVAFVNEGILPEFVGIVNYALIGLIQLSRQPAEEEDMSNEEALQLYDVFARKAFDLMVNKNHDYDEAWRGMRVSSYVDLILMKLYRIKEIEDLNGETLVSEGIDANYMDLINYAVFALIKLNFDKSEK
ncbi:MAG: DUF1599 domain-containing protein [Bacteroidaceae bacterium]|jgi:hypothetical protein